MKTHMGLGRRSLALLGALAAALLLTLTLALAQPAGAQTYPVDPPEDPNVNAVLSEKLTRRPADPQGLPVTGGDVVGLTIVGLTLIGSGVLVLKLRGREPQTA